MKPPVSDIAFTPSVKAAQTRYGSRVGYARMEAGAGWSSAISDDLAEFIADRDSFYMATADRRGQPYIQHRGGPPGFLRVIDDHTLAFADFSGNRQYITVGNLDENDRAFIFLMDYPNRRRVKLWGRAEYVDRDDDPALIDRLEDPAYEGQPERAIKFHVEAWDVNCPQHITPRFTQEEVAALMQPLHDRIAELEARIADVAPVRPDRDQVA